MISISPHFSVKARADNRDTRSIGEIDRTVALVAKVPKSGRSCIAPYDSSRGDAKEKERKTSIKDLRRV